MLRTGTRPLPFEETVELMAVIIAGIRKDDKYKNSQEFLIDKLLAK